VPECYIDKATQKARDEGEPVLIIDDPDNGYRILGEGDPFADFFDDEDNGVVVLVVYPDGTTTIPTAVF